MAFFHRHPARSLSSAAVRPPFPASPSPEWHSRRQNLPIADVPPANSGAIGQVPATVVRACWRGSFADFVMSGSSSAVSGFAVSQVPFRSPKAADQLTPAPSVIGEARVAIQTIRWQPRRASEAQPADRKSAQRRPTAWHSSIARRNRNRRPSQIAD
jgi:hypothetical protein